MSEQLCIHCIHYQDRSDKKTKRHHCLREATSKKSLVTGEVTYYGILTCEIERSNPAKCGADAKHFVEKPTNQTP